MAFYQDEDEQQQAAQQQGTNVPTGPEAGSFVTGQGASPTPSQKSDTATPDNPGNFVGISQYLEANKPQSSKLGTQVANQVQGTIAQAQQGVNDLTGQFKQQADAGQIKDIQNAVEDAKNITNTAAQGQAGALSQDQTQRFGEVANAQYQGPNSAIETDLYAPVYSEVQKAGKYADLSKDESGSQQLLKDIYQGPNYSAGENRLDSYLLNSQENREKLQEARKEANQGLEAQFEAANQQTADYAAQQKALADSVRQAAQQNLTDVQTKRNQDIQAQLDAISSDWRSEYNKYLDLLKNSNNGQNLQLTPEEAAKLGVDKGQKIFNLLNPAAGNTPEQYLSMQEFDPNKVITKDQQAQLAALDELAGTYGGALQNKYTQADLAGTLTKASAFAADKFGLSAKQAQTAFDAASQIANMVADVSKGANLYEDQVSTVTRQVVDRITQAMPWPLSDIVKEITKWVTDVIHTNVQVGHVDTNVKGNQTVADYLAGKGPTLEDSGTKSLDWGSIVSPGSIISNQADNKIDELTNASKGEVKNNLAAQIEQYLKNAGYYNTIK